MRAVRGGAGNTIQGGSSPADLLAAGLRTPLTDLETLKWEEFVEKYDK